MLKDDDEGGEPGEQGHPDAGEGHQELVGYELRAAREIACVAGDVTARGRVIDRHVLLAEPDVATMHGSAPGGRA